LEFETMKHPIPSAMARIAMAGALALAALGGGVASAQQHDDHHGDQHQGGQHDDHHPGPAAPHGAPAGGHGHWQKGQSLPMQFRDRSHYVDYHRYHLHAPSRGYQWVRTDDGSYAMVAITTGLIAELVAASR
jgi:Ni/Co efflux regulator RcnB